ncbi:MAG: F510_1955 family glycosylhydrolase [Bacillota bacterium]
MHRRLVSAILTLLLLAVAAGCGASPTVTLMHVHGLGYSPDGALYVPAHDGFRVYTGGKWETPDLPRHDYMGFAATREGFYSSGHPAPGSGLPNPLGLLFSPDWGKTLTDLGFRGKVDFHLTAAGYESLVFYGINYTPQQGLPAGLNRTADKGKSWQQGEGRGVKGDLYNLAAHPTEPETMAIGTSEGLFLSTDGGDSFRQVAQGPTTALAFHPDGKLLLFGLTDLRALQLEGGQAEPLPSPRLDKEDPLIYIAVNPARPDEIAVATVGRDLFLQTGGAWKRIAADGKGR